MVSRTARRPGSASDRPCLSWLSKGAGIDLARMTERLISSAKDSAMSSSFAAIRSLIPGPETSPYWPKYTRWTPKALATMSDVVLSEKQECSSSWDRSS